MLPGLSSLHTVHIMISTSCSAAKARNECTGNMRVKHIGFDREQLALACSWREGPDELHVLAPSAPNPLCGWSVSRYVNLHPAYDHGIHSISTYPVMISPILDPMQFLEHTRNSYGRGSPVHCLKPTR